MENGIKTSWRAWVGRRKVGETTARRTWIWAHEHNSKEQPSNGSARALSVRRRAPTIHSIPFHDIPFHDSTLHFITLHYITLRYITLRYIVGELSEFEGALPRSVLAMLVAIAKPAARALPRVRLAPGRVRDPLPRARLDRATRRRRRERSSLR